MITSNLIKNLSKEKGKSVEDLARIIGYTTKNLNKNLKRETVSTKELMLITNEIDVVFEQSHILGKW
ncbi:MAG: XRE family transcriptional regulator [Anaerococcus vaginalis]|uniref:helix-turn-helix domain-containing protein n=1 Tax=Anaerococcus vaginalis TaxID=33037 RepID=UPI0029120B41|nr:helix-turn-helix domain-containing protein [Anaerococcus vaginalis]MDU5086898.1 XRE family transcriptional regulator [Anaerococcus vaginalis]